MPAPLRRAGFLTPWEPETSRIVARGMAPMDDIRDETHAGETYGPGSGGSASEVPPETGHHAVSPKSEARDGAEAPDTSLATTRPKQRNAPRQDPSASFMPPDGIPGMRAGLRLGSLPGP